MWLLPAILQSVLRYLGSKKIPMAINPRSLVLQMTTVYDSSQATHTRY